jgi:hypothetical protein
MVPIDWLLFAILAAVLLGWIVLDRLAAHWQKQSEQRLGEVDAHLEAVQAIIGQVEQGAQTHLPGDREPYGSRATKLHGTLSEIQAEYPRLVRQADALRGECFAESRSPLLTFWYGFGPRPGYYKTCSGKVKKLWQSAAKLREKANDAQKSLDELEELPFTTAQRCKDALKEVQQGLDSARALSHARGQSLEVTRAGLNGLATSLNALPAYFLRGSASQIWQQANRADVSDAWETLDEVEDPAQAYTAKLKTWLTQLHQIKQDVNATWQSVQAADLSLLQTPATLDTGDLGLVDIRGQATAIETWLECPDIDKLGWMAEQAGQLADCARGLVQEARNLEAGYQLFRNTLIQAGHTLRRVGDCMSEMERRSPYRIEWQRSQTELGELHELQKEIGKLGATRSSARLWKDLSRAQALDKGARSLEDRVSAVQKFHARLVPLLEDATIPGQPWLEKAIRLDQSAKPINWNVYDGYDAEVRDIRARAESLSRRHNSVSSYVKRSLPESILNEGFIGETQSLIRDLRAFKSCLERVEQRIDDVTSKVQAARQALDSRLPGLEKFLKEWKLPEVDAQYGGQLAVARQELVEWRDEGRRHDERLKKQDPAQIFKTAKQVAAWAKSCDEAARRLLKEMRSQIESQEADLKGEMQALEAVAARLNKEAAMRDARDLIKLKDKSAGGWDSASGADLIEHLLPRAKELADLLTSFHQARQRIQQQAGDLIILHEQTVTCRDEAKTSYEQLKALTAGDQTPGLRDELNRMRDYIQEGDRTLKQQKDWGDRFDKVRSEFQDAIKTYGRAADKGADVRSLLEQQPTG